MVGWIQIWWGESTQGIQPGGGMSNFLAGGGRPSNPPSRENLGNNLFNI